MKITQNKIGAFEEFYNKHAAKIHARILEWKAEEKQEHFLAPLLCYIAPVLAFFLIAAIMRR